jgi:competence protein ComEC
MEWLTRIPYSFIYTGRPSLVRMVVYFAGLGCLSFFRPRTSRPVRLILLVALQALVIVPAPRPHDGLLRLTFIYVGDGDAILVEAPDGETTLIDAGPNTEIYGQAQNQVIRLVAMKGINALDRVVLTHAHDDHYGGLSALLDNVRVGEILVGGLAGESEYVGAIDRAMAQGVPVRTVKRGDLWRSGEATFEVLHPTGDACTTNTEDANGQSVVVRLEYGSVSFLLTGDITPDVQTLLPATCTVLKAPHHGAVDSIDPGFLASLGAKIAVVSAGSKFGSHPAPATLAMLKASGIETLTTSVDGAVTILTDGVSLEVKTEAGASFKRSP